MSKHLRALGKLKKNVLGLSTTNLAAEVLANMVDKYHLKEASLIERNGKDGRVTLDFPSSIEVTTFVDAINVELSAKCETQTVIDSAKRKVGAFFGVKGGGFMEPIGGIDGDTTSSILNYQRFNNNAYDYVDSSRYIHFVNLVEKGDLRLEFEVAKPATHLNTLIYIYTLKSDENGKEKLSPSKEVLGGIRNEKGNIVIVKSDKENVYNVFTNVSATGTPATTTTYDLNKESFSDFVVEVKEDLKVTYSLTFEKNGLIKEELQVPTERSFIQVEKLVLAYRDTYIKNYTEYLPEFAQLKYFLNQNLEYEFGKYESSFFEGPRGEELGEELSDFEKLRSKYTNFTNDIIDELSNLFYGNKTNSQKINVIEGYRKNISISVLNLGTQNDNSKNILRTYGESNLIVVKDELNSLNTENVEIDAKITTLQSEKTIISEVEVERREQTEDLEEILGGVDTTFNYFCKRRTHKNIDSLFWR
jgi:hypothetical protein